MPQWPNWWDYELVLSPHLVERMQERGYSETDLRSMLADAEGYRASIVPGRFVIASRHESDPWEVVVEPDQHERVLIVITAYGVG